MMPSLDHCINNPPTMTTLRNTLEVFDTYKHREEKDSDEESFHLPLDDDESDQKFQDKKDENETEEEILNKFGSSTAPVEHIDAQMEEQLLNDEEDEKKVNHHVSKEADKVERVNGFGSEETSSVEEGVKTADAPDSGKNTNSPSQNLEEQPTSVVDESGAVGTPCSKDSVKEIEADKLAAQVNGLIDSLEDKEQNCESKNKDPVTKNNDNPPAVDEAKCDNSRNSPKLQNEDSEDLFDISIIRDAEEDNAESAYNEAQAEESHEDSDEKAEDEVTNEKAAEEMEEVEEMDIDRQELNDVEIEEANLKETSDGESENKTETINSEEKLCDNVVVGDKSANECMLDEITGKLTNGEGTEMETDKDTEDGQKRRSLKRASSAEDEHSLAKKSRTDPLGDIESKVEEEPKEKPPLRKLLSLAEFMKTRKNGRKPTMHDLEEFCVQKICEAIVHKSDLGDVHHQLKVQEQLIETMRKEILQLTKQARDLEIVNKKLMNDLKQHNATQKPLSPLKITRSVGLQVKFTPVSSFEANKRRQVNPQPTQNQKIAPLQPATNRSPRAAPAPVQTNANRQTKMPKTLYNTNCCVPGCSSRKNSNWSLHFHNFPKKNERPLMAVDALGRKQEVNRRKLWESVLLLERKATDRSTVCSRHFKESDYYPKSDRSKMKAPRLIKTAVPSLNLPQATSELPGMKVEK